MPPHARDEIFFPREDARLRAAEEFIAAKGHQADSGFDALSDRGFADAVLGKINEAARTEVLDERQTGALT